MTGTPAATTKVVNKKVALQIGTNLLTIEYETLCDADGIFPGEILGDDSNFITL